MRIIGLTGSIACGKSAISRQLAADGYPVIDGDVISRQLTAPGSPVLGEIRRAFGPGVFDESGALNRKALGQIVFASDTQREKLDALMAPHLRARTEAALARARADGARLCFLEMPLLFEKGYDALCDTVWCVWLPPEEQLRRLTARDRISREEALARMHAVLSSDEKAARSQVVIDNSGDLAETLRQLPALLKQEEALAAPRRRRSDRYQAATEPPDEGTPAPAEAAAMPPRPQATGREEGPSPAPAAARRSAEPPAEAPPVLERPERARRQPSKRKVAWKMPVWLMVTLITFSSVLAVSFTAQCLMRAYLTRQAEKHAAEQRAIDARYPLMYRELIEKYAEEFNLQPAYVSAIILNESSFDLEAESRVGARGLMQLMPDTAEWIARKLRVEGYAFERMYDPESNIRFGCWYLNYLCSLFQGDPVCVTCAYHAGQGEIAGWLSMPEYSPDGVTLPLDRLPEGPTRTYAERVTRDYGIYQAKYFSPAAPEDGGAAGGAHIGAVRIAAR